MIFYDVPGWLLGAAVRAVAVPISRWRATHREINLDIADRQQVHEEYNRAYAAQMDQWNGWQRQERERANAIDAEFLRRTAPHWDLYPHGQRPNVYNVAALRFMTHNEARMANPMRTDYR